MTESNKQCELMLCYGAEQRMLEEAPKTMDQLNQAAREVFEGESCKFTYYDEDGDMITIKTDAELMLAYDAIMELGESCLKILVDINIKIKSNSHLLEDLGEIESVESFELASPNEAPKPEQEIPGNSVYYSNDDVEESTVICNARMDIVDLKLFKGEYTTWEQARGIWTLKNVGDEHWPDSCTLDLVKGQVEFGTVEISPLIPGEAWELELNFVVPSLEGVCKHEWRLRTPNGSYFGPKLSLKYLAVADTGEMTPEMAEQFQALIEMGFPPEDARKEIIAANGDVDLAVSIMMKK